MNLVRAANAYIILSTSLLQKKKLVDGTFLMRIVSSVFLLFIILIIAGLEEPRGT
jgi:hypothetical protein